MDKEKISAVRFSFPNDEGKTPLVSFTVCCDERDFRQLEQAMLWRSAGAYAFTILGAVLTVIILFQIVIIALAAGQPMLAAAYVIFALSAAFSGFMNVRRVKRAVRKAPNGIGSFTYAFYRHHFTFSSDYEGISESYDSISRGIENTLDFMLFRSDGKTFLIPKSELSEEKAKLLRAVMENKLGSKFTLKQF